MTLAISAVVLAADDFDRAKEFYSKGLGCKVEVEQGTYVQFDLGDGGPRFSLYSRRALAHDAGVEVEGSGFSGVTLHYFVDANEKVGETLAAAEKAGGTIPQPAQQSQWGGYFADLDGHLWKVVSTT